jgi:hypothetical protein
MRVPAEDRRQVATVINGREYAARDGFFEMPEADAKVHSKSANLPASWQAFRGAFRRQNGYRCTSCGFGSFFKSCSRCGSECVREGNDAAASTQEH